MLSSTHENQASGIEIPCANRRCGEPKGLARRCKEGQYLTVDHTGPLSPSGLWRPFRPLSRLRFRKRIPQPSAPGHCHGLTEDTGTDQAALRHACPCPCPGEAGARARTARSDAVFGHGHERRAQLVGTRAESGRCQDSEIGWRRFARNFSDLSRTLWAWMSRWTRPVTVRCTVQRLAEARLRFGVMLARPPKGHCRALSLHRHGGAYSPKA